MPSNSNEQSKVNNPLTGAGAFGLGGAAAVALGAVIRGNSVHDEAMTVLVGGAITGALAGSIGCCIPGRTKDSPLALKICLGALEGSIGLAASLTAPLMGEHIMNLGTDWGKVIVDELVAAGVIVGGVAGVTTVAAGLCYGAYKLSECISSSSVFSNRGATTNSNNSYTQTAAVSTVSENDVTVVGLNKV